MGTLPSSTCLQQPIRRILYPCMHLFRIHVTTLEEVEDPPETVTCHTETPRIMLQLKSSYIKENLQVW